MIDVLAFLCARLNDADEDAQRTLAANALARRAGLSSTLWDEEDHWATWTRRDVAAKRRLIELHELVQQDGRCAHCVQWCDDCDNQTQCDHGTENRPWPCPTVRVVTSIYSDHVDYRQEWAG